MLPKRLYQRIKVSGEILAKIAKIDELKGQWRGGLALSPQILGRLKSYVIITSSGASTRIEGAKMSDAEVARLLRGLKSQKPKGRDAEEVAGYADLLGRIFDHYKTLKLAESQLLHFHKILLNFSAKDKRHKGKYKIIDNAVTTKNEKGETVILFRPTPPYLVKKEMDDIIYWTEEEFKKEEIHPLLIICNFIFEFLAVHPFLDGNGRLSRALTNFLLLKNGYGYIPYVSLEEIIERKRVDYYLALRATQKNHKTKKEDITPWINFTLNILLEQAQKAVDIMRLSQPEKMLSEKQQAVYNLFTAENVLNVSEIYRKYKGKIPEITIKQALSRLVALKLIERIGMGRGTRYRKL